MSTEQQQTIATEVFAALENGTLELPTLPDVAIKIRTMMDDPNVSAEGIVRLLSTDPSISAQIIKAANSAAYASGNPVSDLRTAISRLGYRTLYTIVMTITMSHLFKANSRIINQKLKQVWDHSREVAANSYVLALHQKHLKPEQAMLAGMLHDLGALPLCMYADRNYPDLDLENLEGLIRNFHTEVGARVLTSWNFSAELVEVVTQHEDLQHMTENGMSDYIDVVAVANLMKPSSVKFVAWENVRAVERLGFNPDMCRNFFTTYTEQLTVALKMLGVNPDKTSTPLPATRTQAVTTQLSRATPKEKPEISSGILSRLFNLFR